VRSDATEAGEAREGLVGQLEQTRSNAEFLMPASKFGK
jgi:hypothetical protein